MSLEDRIKSIKEKCKERIGLKKKEIRFTLKLYGRVKREDEPIHKIKEGVDKETTIEDLKYLLQEFESDFAECGFDHISLYRQNVWMSPKNILKEEDTLGCLGLLHDDGRMPETLWLTLRLD